jgi:hypothetical protein
MRPTRRTEASETGSREPVAGEPLEREPAEREPVERGRSRRSRAWRTGDAGAAAVGTAGAGVVLLARLVMLGATLIALLIAVAIVSRMIANVGQGGLLFESRHRAAAAR